MSLYETLIAIPRRQRLIITQLVVHCGWRHERRREGAVGEGPARVWAQNSAACASPITRPLPAHAGQTPPVRPIRNVGLYSQSDRRTTRTAKSVKTVRMVSEKATGAFNGVTGRYAPPLPSSSPLFPRLERQRHTRTRGKHPDRSRLAHTNANTQAKQISNTPQPRPNFSPGQPPGSARARSSHPLHPLTRACPCLCSISEMLNAKAALRLISPHPALRQQLAPVKAGRRRWAKGWAL